MSKPNKEQIMKDSEINIVYSLNYLLNEAKKLESEHLSSILEVALMLAHKKSFDPRFVLHNSTNDEDTLKAAYFILKFLDASDETKHNFIECISQAYEN